MDISQLAHKFTERKKKRKKKNPAARIAGICVSVKISAALCDSSGRILIRPAVYEVNFR